MSFNMEKVLLIKLLLNLAAACIVIATVHGFIGGRRRNLVMEFALLSPEVSSMSCYCWLERLLRLGFLLGVLSSFQFSPPFEMMNFYGFLNLCFLVFLSLYYFCF